MVDTAEVQIFTQIQKHTLTRLEYKYVQIQFYFLLSNFHPIFIQ